MGLSPLVEVERIFNDYIEVCVSPQYGFSILSIIDKNSGAEALWQRQPFHPTPPSREIGVGGSASETHFFDRFLGGWFEMFPVVGFPDADDTVHHLHGEVVQLPWEVTDITKVSISAEVDCLRTPFHLTRRLELVDDVLHIFESVTNLGRASCSFSWGHHPCFSRSTFAGGHIQLSVDKATVPAPPFDPLHAILVPGQTFQWPNAPLIAGGELNVAEIPMNPDFRHDHICLSPDKGELSISSPILERSLSVEWEIERFPHILIWLDFQGQNGFPMYGCTDTFAIEFSDNPGRSMDDARQENALSELQPCQEISTAIALRWHKFDPSNSI